MIDTGIFWVWTRCSGRLRMIEAATTTAARPSRLRLRTSQPHTTRRLPFPNLTTTSATSKACAPRAQPDSDATFPASPTKEKLGRRLPVVLASALRWSPATENWCLSRRRWCIAMPCRCPIHCSRLVTALRVEPAGSRNRHGCARHACRRDRCRVVSPRTPRRLDRPDACVARGVTRPELAEAG